MQTYDRAPDGHDKVTKQRVDRIVRAKFPSIRRVGVVVFVAAVVAEDRSHCRARICALLLLLLLL